MILGSITVKEDEYRDSRAYNRYSQVKRSVSNRWQRVINTREDDKTYVWWRSDDVSILEWFKNQFCEYILKISIFIAFIIHVKNFYCKM